MWLQVASAFLILLPAAATLASPCNYADGGRSLLRWTAALRSILSLLQLALKLCDVRLPTRSHPPEG